MEMDKILDQLLMPPPALPVGDNLKDLSGTSLDRSHGSSATNSSNSSWLSESSCGCHSPRTAVKKSNITFYRRPILPPLLCGTARMEMISYRTKALEKERRKRQHSRSKLLSRVEAILSSVDVPETSPSSSQDSSPKIPLANSTTCNDSASKAADLSHLTMGESEMPSPAESVHEVIKTIGDGNEGQATPEKLPEEKVESPSSSSSDSEAVFQTDAYRKSLQNLLQKSMNSTLNDTFTMHENTKTEQQASSGSSHSATSSTTTENVWAENTQATVIQTNQNVKADIPSLDPLSASMADLRKVAESPLGLSSEAGAMAESLVDSVLEEVRSELTMYASFHLPSTSHSEVASGENTPRPEDIAKCENRSKDSLTEDVKSELPKSPIEQLDVALEMIGSQLASTCDDSLARNDKISGTHSLVESVQDDTPSTTTEGSSFEEQLRKEVSTISSATPETVALVSSYQHALENEEVPVSQLSDNADNSTVFTGSLHDEAPFAFENEATITTQDVFTETDNGEKQTSAEDNTLAMKLQRQSEGRKRSNSYSTHAPSPLLMNSREEHTIYSIEVDDENRSEATSDSIFCRDVKRRLEMPSDSEESTVSLPRSKAKSVKSPRKASMSKEEYCRKLEEQHKHEMEELQRKHEMQLQKLQEELLRGNPNLASAMGSLGSIDLDQLLSTKRGNEASRQNGPMPMPHQTKRMHLRWCKLSALVKGHLTRQLLGSRAVQTIMQTIRDTSRTILAMRSEQITTAETNMKTMQDATLLDRLFLQLRASMFEFHAMFFDTSLQERLNMIAQSREMDRKELLNSQERRKGQRLSSATLKALQRKKVERLSKKPALTENNNRLKSSGAHPKEVKSKISYIWKSGPKAGTGKQAAGRAGEKKKKGGRSPYANAKSLVDVHRSSALAPSIR